MAEKLAGLVVPVLEPLGYRQGWGLSTLARIGQEIPVDVGRLTLCQQDIDDVLNCGGLWQGKDETIEYPAYVFMLHRDLIVRVTREYLEAFIIGEVSQPIDFVHQFLGTEANFDALTATWLFLQNETARVELEHELTEAITNLLDAWPQIIDGTQTTIGPVLHDIAIGDVVLEVDAIDVTFGDHRVGAEVNWPGVVLVHFVAKVPTPKDLEDMALGALVHGITSGCPPQRLVVWGLQSGIGIGMDVERDWLELAIGGTQAAIKTIAKIRNDRGVEIMGGSHCFNCPLNRSCELSQVDESPF